MIKCFMQSTTYVLELVLFHLVLHTVWPEILAGNLFWRIGSFENYPPIFHPPKTSQCDVIIIVKSYPLY